jgi:hypothetical protein
VFHSDAPQVRDYGGYSCHPEFLRLVAQGPKQNGSQFEHSSMKGITAVQRVVRFPAASASRWLSGSAPALRLSEPDRSFTSADQRNVASSFTVCACINTERGSPSRSVLASTLNVVSPVLVSTPHTGESVTVGCNCAAAQQRTIMARVAASTISPFHDPAAARAPT